MNSLKNCNVAIIDKNVDVSTYKQELLMNGNIIVHEIPNHNLGHHIFYYNQDIRTELKNRFGDNLIYFDENTIMAKTCDPKNGDPIGDVLELYNKEESNLVPKYKNGIRTVKYS